MSELDFPQLATWNGAATEPSPLPLGSLIDPNSGRVLADNRGTDDDQLERSIRRAHESHLDGRWSSLPDESRIEVLERWARWLEGRVETIAVLDALNSGVPISVTRLLAGSLPGTIRGAIGQLRAAPTAVDLEPGRHVALRRVPWGPAALLAPWNAPAPMAAKKLAFALAAGSTAILKPSPASPWSAQILMQGLYDSGLPDGVAHLVLGDANAGAVLARDSRIASLSLTGSTATGRAVASAAGPRFARLRLELGSNNPAIVLADGDPVRAARSIVAGTLTLSGQWCEAPRRVYVPRELRDELVSAIEQELRTLRIGHSLDERTEVGPVAFPGRVAALRVAVGALGAAGARICAPQSVPDRGSFFPPTMAVLPDGVELDDELFGPVLAVQTYDDVADAIARANAGRTGLAAYVFGSDETGALKVGHALRVGEVRINGTGILDLADGAVQSFFGDSGLGGHGDADMLAFFRGTQVMGVDAAGRSG